MSPKEKIERKLAAIVFSDIVSFTQLSAKNEPAALKLLDKQRVLYTRLSLSDDPEAKQMKKQVDLFSNIQLPKCWQFYLLIMVVMEPKK